MKEVHVLVRVRTRIRGHSEEHRLMSGAGVRSPRRADPQTDGFTLVEMIVAITLLAVIMLEVASVFGAAAKLSGTTNNRARAEAIASRETDALKAIPYARLGFKDTQPGFVSSFENPTPSIPNTVIVPDPGTTPTASETFGAIVFNVRRHIVWESASASQPQAYKRTAVIVSWGDSAGNHEVRQNSIIYPSGSGAYVVPGGSVPAPVTPPPGAPDPPTTLLATLPITGTDRATRVDLVWTPPLPSLTAPPVATWAVEWAAGTAPLGSLSWNRVTQSHPAASLEYSVTGLSPSTPYRFRVLSRSAAGTDSLPSPVSATVTTDALSSSACVVNSAVVTPGAIYRTPGATTLSPNPSAPLLSVNSMGCSSASSIRVVYRPVAGATDPPPGSMVQTTGAPNVWSFSLPVTTAWDIGNHRLLIQHASGTQLSEVAFVVCIANAPTCP